VFVLFGCLAAAALALLVDQCCADRERVAQSQPRTRGAWRGRHRGAGRATLVPTLARSSSNYIVGAKTLPSNMCCRH